MKMKQIGKGLKAKANHRCRECHYSKTQVSKAGNEYSFCEWHESPCFVIIQEGLERDEGWECSAWADIGLPDPYSQTYTGTLEVNFWRSGRGAFVRADGREFVAFSDCVGFDRLNNSGFRFVLTWSVGRWNGKTVLEEIQYDAYPEVIKAEDFCRPLRWGYRSYRTTMLQDIGGYEWVDGLPGEAQACNWQDEQIMRDTGRRYCDCCGTYQKVRISYEAYYDMTRCAVCGNEIFHYGLGD